MNRTDLYKTKEFRQVYYWLRRNNPKLLNKHFPHILDNDSFSSMLLTMPKDCKFGENQIWKGLYCKYKFIDKEFGEFISTPANLMKQSWPKQRTGHPKKRYIDLNKNLRKPVVNLGTGQIFISISEAIRSGFTDVQAAVKKGTKCGGHHWAYCDEKGNIIKKT